MHSLLSGFSMLAALGCGVIAGVFFAFSSFVMAGFARLPPSQGIAAMQAINEAAARPAFLLVFLGTAAICAVLAVATLLDWNAPASAWRLAGALLYLGGAIGVTRLCNIPRNDALAAVVPDSTEAPARWAAYRAGWMPWNHVRAVACLAAAAAFIVGV